MSCKRSRKEYEADLHQKQSPFVLYGTAFPALDPDVRDDGTYVPVWKQEVRDDKGRRRLHGAFTGGWSAGYLNTVGSKDGWTPSTFVSSRTNRLTNDGKSASQQRPEDFMDEEDLADAEDSRRIQTSQGFTPVGAANQNINHTDGLAGLFHVQGETIGSRLLKKMGWKEGQGIGPKVRRTANLEMTTKLGPADTSKTYLFAPENVYLTGISRKTDRKGLGFDGESRLEPLASSRARQPTQADEAANDGDGFSLGRPKSLVSMPSRTNDRKVYGGIGVGVLNDTGSDDEDPYELGPQISYNKVLGGDNKKKKRQDMGLCKSANPALRSRPVFMPKRTSVVTVRKCHDGRPALKGFVLGQDPDLLISMVSADGKYHPPEIPADWKSSKSLEASSRPSEYTCSADAAKMSQLNPSSRAAILGEKQLPGKSVFDYLSSSARDRLAAATGKADLPEGKGEIPEGFALSEEEKRRSLWDQIPKLDKDSALAGLTKGASGGGPYGDNEKKQSRYRLYLEMQAGIRSEPPTRPSTMTHGEWIQELDEFRTAARIFRPISGTMASRFTTSSPSTVSVSGGTASMAAAKAPDPAEAAAKIGMFGHMTRFICDFYPTRLLCKRFNVRPPAHVQGEQDGSGREASGRVAQRPVELPRNVDARNSPHSTLGRPGRPGTGPESTDKQEEMVDSTRNDALEGRKAGEEVFKAIFGDSSDEN